MEGPVRVAEMPFEAAANGEKKCKPKKKGVEVHFLSRFFKSSSSELPDQGLFQQIPLVVHPARHDENEEGAEGGSEHPLADLQNASVVAVRMPSVASSQHPRGPPTPTVPTPSPAGPTPPGKIARTSFLGNVKITTQYVVSDVQKHKRSFVIGVITIFLVVCFLTLVQSLLSRSNLILLKLAEDQVGQYDILFTPVSSRSPFINFTTLNESLSTADCVAGVAPRWIFPATVSNPSRSGFPSSLFLLIMDTSLEKEIGIGKKWSHRALGPREVHLTDSLVRTLGVRPQAGDRITIKMELVSFLQNAGLISTAPEPDPFLNQTGFPPRNTSSGSGESEEEVDPIVIIDALPITQETKDFFRTPLGKLVLVILKPFLDLSSLSFSQEFTVIDALDSPEGKYPAYLGNVAILEKSMVEEMLIDGLRIFNPDSLKNFHLQDYSQSVVSLLKDRVDLYLQPNKERDREWLDHTDEIHQALNSSFNMVYISTPVQDALEQTESMGLLLQEIFFLVIGVLVMLAVLLIYSLLLSGVDEKTFEYGMLRSLGMNKRLLILLLITQALYFAIPGISAGFLVAYVLYIPIDFLLSWFVGASMQPYLSWQAIVLGLVLGLVMPFLGMLLPLRRALGRSLRDALDIYHNVAYDSVVKITKLQNLGVSLIEILVALLLVTFGGIVYYLVPLSFIFGDMPLFLRIFSVVILGMIVGLVLLSQALDYFIETTVATLLMWGPDMRLRSIVGKNLAGHRRRNKKTATMFTLCLGFIVFAATLFVLQAQSISMNLKWTNGADVIVQASGVNDPLPRANLRAFLDSISKSRLHPGSGIEDLNACIVESYSFITFPLNSLSMAKRSTISAISPARTEDVAIIGVDKNFQDTVYPEYVIFGEKDERVIFNVTDSAQRAVIPALYNVEWTPEGNQSLPVPIVIFPKLDRVQQEYRNSVIRQETRKAYRSIFYVLASNSLQDGISVNVNVTMQLSVTSVVNAGKGVRRDHITNYQVRALSFVKKLSGLPLINENVVANSPVLVSFPQFHRLYREIYELSNATQTPTSWVPMQRLLVRVSPDATDIQIEGLVNTIKANIPDRKVTVINLREQLSQTELASFLLMVFFNIVAVIGMVFSFFVLWLSFTANVRENSWEYGVLRAIGLTGSTASRLYVYESLAIVFSSLVLGTALGIFTAIVMTLQFNLFSQMPFTFNFPTGLFAFVVALSLFVAVLGSHLPSKKFLKEEIAIILRG